MHEGKNAFLSASSLRSTNLESKQSKRNSLRSLRLILGVHLKCIQQGNFLLNFASLFLFQSPGLSPNDVPMPGNQVFSSVASSLRSYCLYYLFSSSPKHCFFDLCHGNDVVTLCLNSYKWMEKVQCVLFWGVCLHLSQLFVYIWVSCLFTIVIFCLFSNYLLTFCSKIKPNTGLDTLNFSVAYLLVYL